MQSSYGFIHYYDRRCAALAILSLNGRHLLVDESLNYSLPQKCFMYSAVFLIWKFAGLDSLSKSTGHMPVVRGKTHQVCSSFHV